MSEEPTLSIGEASHILGVTEVTLRQWTDEGKVRAFVTPGGHRRYSMSNLKRLMSQHARPHGIKDLASRLEDTAHVHREIAASYFRQSSLNDRLDSEAQKHFASLGRHFLDLIIRYISEPVKRDGNLQLVKEAGAGFGEFACHQDLTLIETMQVYLQHRNTVIGVTTDMIKNREGISRRIIDSISMVNYALDQALLSLVTSYQLHSSSINKAGKKR